MGHHETPSPAGIDRRQFLISATALAGGLVIGIGPASKAGAAIAKALPWEQSGGTEFTGFLVISPDNTVTVRTTKTDIGNGAFSAQAMIVNEELKADWSKVRSEMLPDRSRYSERPLRCLDDFLEEEDCLLEIVARDRMGERS